MNKILGFSLCTLILLSSCKPTDKGPGSSAADEAFYNQIQEKLILAQAGDVIEIPEGVFELDRPLSLEGIANVTIKGAGMDKTILSFKMQKVGAEGIRITADSVTISDLTVQDTKGDGIKLQDCQGITLRNIRTTWSGGAKASNGGYGLYPVSSTNVLIDGCEASYASDAGIYVGQCHQVVVRNCYAFKNVAGIEIENCINSEVYGNKAMQNTGGILVFDLPDLPQVNGHSCRVYDNKIIENNHKNFAPAGNIVGTVPPGTGILMLAAKRVEIFNNEIIGHKTMGTTISSYHVTEKPWNDKNYDPFSYDIYIHDNTYERKKALPDLTKDFGKMINLLFKGKPQDIIYDGILNPAHGDGTNPMNICIQQNPEGLRFANVDAANEFDNVQKDLGVYNCVGVKLDEVKLAF